MTEAAKSNAATENITTTTTTEDLWMAGPTELRLTHLGGVDLDVGAGVWVYAQEQHWISVYHRQYTCVAMAICICGEMSEATGV